VRRTYLSVAVIITALIAIFIASVLTNPLLPRLRPRPSILLVILVTFGATALAALWKKHRRVASLSLKRPPGTHLLSIVEFFYSPADVDGTFEPIIADWRKEYFEALKQSRKWKARWISARYIFRFGQAMGLSKTLGLMKEVLKAVKSATRLIR